MLATKEMNQFCSTLGEREVFVLISREGKGRISNSEFSDKYGTVHVYMELHHNSSVYRKIVSLLPSSKASDRNGNMWEELISICVGVDGNNGIELI